MIESRWLFRDEPEAHIIAVPGLLDEVTASLNQPAWLAKIILQRAKGENKEISINEIKKFLYPSLKDLPDPFLLIDMEKSSTRIARAIIQNEKIGIYGDYDVDGTVGAAILRRFFRSIGVDTRVYQPDRKSEGYGMNIAAIELLHQEGIQLLISVDCGISNVAEAARAKDLGLDLIIVDHHEVPNPMPNAYAVLDHKRPDDASPIKNLCGSGMAFYLVMAIRAKLRAKSFFQDKGVQEPDLRSLLDLVALATVADMVPLVGENRILVKIGLEKMRKNPTIGIAALCRVAGISISDVSTYHLGFILGPRVNASGRLGSASIALELLVCDDLGTAESLASELQALNAKRMALQKKIVEEALEQAELKLADTTRTYAGLVLAAENWHEGVIGIVAAKIMERFHRPVVICSFENNPELGKGSVRSLKEIDILQVLQECQECLVSFGGHKVAAGLSIRKSEVEKFQELFSLMVERQVIGINGEKTNNVLPRTIRVDIDLSSEKFDHESLRSLDVLAPFGIGNPEPVVHMKNASVLNKKIMKEEHLKLWLRLKNGSRVEALWFNALKGKELVPGQVIDMVFTPQVSTFRGMNRLEFRLRDIQLA